MIAPTTPDHGTSLLFVEGGLTVILIALAMALPRLGSGFFAWVERLFTGLARRKGLAVAVVGISDLALRLAVLPIFPIPKPIVPDDFSFLLAADTFASGRLANPTPAMWQHFESIHIDMQPTYMSMYFPGQGLLLAASKVLFGHPWFGLLIVTALMCAAICWMLQAWMPPTWALLGGFIAVLHLGIFSYWINTYHAGSIVAFAGALVLGALPRFIKKVRLRDSLLMALGIVLLIISRPYEGVLLCLPVGFVFVKWAFFSKQRPAFGLLFRRTALPLALIAGAIAWMGYYDYKAFGNPLTPPYSINRNTYAIAPYYVWQSQRPEPAYHHEVMRRFYNDNELPSFTKIHSVGGFIPETLFKCVRGFLFYAGFLLLPPMIMVRRVFLDRRIRFLIVVVLVMTAGLTIEIFLLPHYLAPFTAAFYAIGLQAMRHLRVWRPGDQPAGLSLVRLTITFLILICGLRLAAEPLQMSVAHWPGSDWNMKWYGPGNYGESRAAIEARLEKLPGRQVVLVRYGAKHIPIDEWVYNSPDIENSKVVWAHDMDPVKNKELMDYYKGSTVWLVQPDLKPAGIEPYSLPFAGTQAAR